MNFEGTPLVSVLMTSFNREKYIAEAIKSVLASTYKNFELIIADDASYDSTVEIAKKYEHADSRVKVYANPENLGQFANRNKAAEYASGKYIKYFDSDDVLFPHALETMVESMEKYPEAGAGLIYYNDHLKKATPLIFTPRECYINHYFKGITFLTVGPSGSIFVRKIFEEMGRFDTTSGILADTLLMLRIAAIYPIVGIEKDLFHWRMHDEQVTEGQKNIYEMIAERYSINQKVLAADRSPLSEVEKKMVKRNLKNIVIRTFPRIIFKIPLDKSFKLFKLVGVNATDILSSFFPNRTINH
ncbi:MAG: glycosyltransferase family 2 protein [Sphingobacteriales bacterium]|nr:MAG: glycosyltransferase family 2 protein [Sphingobacteriales bacterium]